MSANYFRGLETRQETYSCVWDTVATRTMLPYGMEGNHSLKIQADLLCNKVSQNSWEVFSTV